MRQLTLEGNAARKLNCDVETIGTALFHGFELFHESVNVMAGTARQEQLQDIVRSTYNSPSNTRDLNFQDGK